MRKPLLPALLILLIVVGLAACGGGDEDPGDTSDIKKYDRSQTARKLAEAKAEEADTYGYDDEDEETGEEAEEADAKGSGLIRSASLSPDTLRADSTITIEVKTAAPLNENQALIYKYWKNGEPLEETKEPKLPAFSWKKHDVFFADVMLYEDDQLIARKRTGMKPVLNSPPVIETVTLPDVQGPGTYEFVVKSKDADDDQITFSLEEADDLQVDAQIDPSTGTVTCILDDNPPESIKFTIAADDGDRGVTKKIVSMRFFRRPKKEE